MAFDYTSCTSFWGAECVIDHCLVVVKFRERLAVSKQAAQNLTWKVLISGTLSELQVKVLNHIKMSHRFAALDNLNESEDINMALENIS